jgi:hypothetical protein
VDEERKETRLQGLKDQLAAAGDDDAEELRQEIEDIIDRIKELTSFRIGTEMEELRNHRYLHPLKCRFDISIVKIVEIRLTEEDQWAIAHQVILSNIERN